MANSKQRANASNIYDKKPQSVLEKMITPNAGRTSEQPGEQLETAQPQEEQEQQSMETGNTGQQQKGGRTLKQVAFALGQEREEKLDELAYQYNRKKKTRIGRNDIARYLIDELTVEDLLQVDLLKYKK